MQIPALREPRNNYLGNHRRRALRRIVALIFLYMAEAALRLHAPCRHIGLLFELLLLLVVVLLRLLLHHLPAAHTTKVLLLLVLLLLLL